MPVINKDDFSAFDEALKSAPAAKTTTDEFSVFDEALKKNDGQDGGLEEDGTSPTQLESDSQLPLTKKRPAEIIVEPTQNVKIESNPITLISDKTKAEREYADALANENMVGASEAQKKLDKINFELKATGTDDKSINDLNKELSDFPWGENITKSVIIFNAGKYGYPNKDYSLPEILSITREKDYPAYLSYLAAYKIGDLIEKNTGNTKGEVIDFLNTKRAGGDFSKGVSGLQEIEDYANTLKQNIRKHIGVDNLGVEKDDTKKALGLIDEYTSSLIYRNYDVNEAKEFLQGKLNDTDLELKQPNVQQDIIQFGVREDGEINYPKYTSDIDLDNFDLNSISSKLDLSNPAIKTAYDVYARKVGLDNALGKIVTSPDEPTVYNNGHEWTQEDFENAAINYESLQTPLIAKQIEAMGGQMPESMKGNVVQSFLNNPDVIEAAKTNPDLARIYNETKRGFRFRYPESNVTRISTIISQGLEDMGETNWLVNIPTQDQVDNVVERLKRAGKLSDTDVQDYEKSIRDDIGILMSAYRGLGRIPFGAFIPEAKIQTAGVLENTQNEFNTQIGGYARSIEDFSGMSRFIGTKQRLYNILSKNATNVNLDLKGTHEISAGTGHIIGFTIPLITGGEVLKGVEGAHYINTILAFEGHNRDRAIELFPGNTTKQVGYTLAATTGDALIGELLPTKAISKAVSNAFKKDAKIIINNLVDNKITQNEAISKLSGLPRKIIPFLGKNTSATAVMTAFGLYKEALGKGFGAINQDKSYTELAYDAVNGAKTTFLTTPVLTLLEMKGTGTGSNKANHKVLWEIANDPAKYEKIINDEALTNPDIASQKEEMLNNLKISTTILKDLNESGIDITTEQKQKYLVAGVKKDIWMRKAANTSDPNISQKYVGEATKYDNIQKEILDNKDKAEELNNYDVAEDEIVEEVPGQEVPVLTSEEAFKGISEEETGYLQDVLNRINKNESINEKELKDAEDIAYTAYDNNQDAARFIEPIIIKIQNHENVTKTETVQTTEKQPIEGTFGARQKIEIKPALQQSEGSTARVVLADGTEGEGTLKVKNGNYVIEVKGQEPIVIGEKAITDRDLKAPEGESPIELDENGNVKSATFETKDGHKVTITDPEKALDLGIQLSLETIGEIPDEAFDKAYEDVVKETQVEVPVERPKVEKKVETEAETPKQKQGKLSPEEADIEERRKKELDELENTVQLQPIEVLDEKGNVISTTDKKAEINARYDAERQALKVNDEPQIPTQKKKQAKGKAAKFVAEYVEKREGEEGKEGEPKGAVPTQTHTVETIDQADTTGFNEVQKKNVNDAKRILKVIAKLVGKETGKKLKLVIHSTRASAAKAVYDSTIKSGGSEAEAKANMQNQGNRGWWSSADGEIHLNIAEVASETIQHEVTHPILDAIAKVRPEIIDQFHKQLESLPQGKEIIALAEENYAGDNSQTIKNEAITDYIAKVADGQIKIDKSNFQKVKDYIVNLLTKIGLAPEKDIRSIDDLRKLAQTISEKFAKGEEIDIKDSSANKSRKKVQFQTEKLFKADEKQIEKLLDNAGKNKTGKKWKISDVANVISKYIETKKVFDKPVKEISDKEFVSGIKKETEKELNAWEESVGGKEYVSFYKNDITDRLNPKLQQFAEKRYGRKLTSEEVSLYHLVSAFASPEATPEFDSSKGLEVFDKYMKTGELSGLSDKQATIWALNEKGVKEDTGVPKFTDSGEPVMSKWSKGYADYSLNKFKKVIDYFNGDLKEATKWMQSIHSYEEISNIMGTPLKGVKSLEVHENLSKENGGFGIFGFTGAKLGSYALNRMGEYSTITKDMWYARTMARLSGESMFDEKGDAVKRPWGFTNEDVRKRKLADKAWEEVAKKKGLLPSDVQERMWDYEKRLYEKLGAVESASYASDGFMKQAKAFEPEIKFTEPDSEQKPILFSKKKDVSLESKQDENARTEKERTSRQIKVNSEKVQYNGKDAIGSRTRTESEQIASRNEAKAKIKNPETNASLKAANSYNESVGLPEVTPHKYKPSDPVQQTKLAKLYPKLQDVNSPTYKETEIEKRIYSEYKSKHPEIFKQYKIKDYKDLVNKSYEQLIKETQLQYDKLPVKVTFHEAGEGNYENNFEMLDDVHNFNHLWVYKGGDDHTALGSKTIDKEGLTANDKFRAVHDYYGHSVEGYQFGKDGEENAWIEHSKMFSPLAQWALSSETRGQNSWVNYSGVNDAVLETIKTGSALKKEGKKLGNQEMIDEGEKLLSTVYDDFQFAEQKAIVLPPEFTDISKFHTTKISGVPEQLKSLPKFSKTATKKASDILSKYEKGTYISSKELTENETSKDDIVNRVFDFFKNKFKTIKISGQRPTEGSAFYNKSEKRIDINKNSKHWDDVEADNFINVISHEYTHHLLHESENNKSIENDLNDIKKDLTENTPKNMTDAEAGIFQYMVEKKNSPQEILTYAVSNPEIRKFLVPYAEKINKISNEIIGEDVITKESQLLEQKGIKLSKRKIDWEESKEGKGDPTISARNPIVQEAAKDLKEGKITNEEYRAVASENSPIRPITRFFEPATEDRIKLALSEDKTDKINTPVEDGKEVGLRLDIPAYKNNNTWVVSVHEGTTIAGKAISYTNVAKIKDVSFSVEPKAALNIAAGVAKTTIGRMFGKWENIEGDTLEAKGENAKELVQNIVSNPNWVQVGMNPFRHSYFYDRSSDIGRPIKSAEEVVQVGGLVYAKKPKYGEWTDEAYTVKGLLDAGQKPIQFSASKDKKISDMKDILREYVDEGKSLNEIKEIMKDEFGDYYKDVEGVIEQAHQEMTTTAIKNAVTERERAERGLTEVEVEAKRSFGKVFDDAKNMVANGEANGLTLAAEVVKNPRPLKAEESAVLLIDRMRISNEYNRKNTELLKAQENGETSKADIIQSQLDVLEEEMNLNDEAARKSGYEQGLGLAARRMLIAQDYSLVTQMNRLKAANGGKEVPKHYQEQLKDLLAKLDEANQKLEKFEKNQIGTEKQKQLGKVIPVPRTPEQAAKEKANIKSKILAKWGQTLARMKAASGNIKRSVSGTPMTPEKKAQLESIVKDVNDMVRLYAELGETNLRTIINDIHKDLVGDIPDLSKSDIEDVVLGKYDVEKEKKQLTEEQKEKKERLNKVDLQKAYLKNGFSGIANDVKARIKDYATKGETNLKKITKDIFDYYKSIIPEITESDMNDIILGIYDVKRIGTPLTNEKVQAMANVRKVETQIYLLKEELKNNQRSGVEKSVDYIHGWHRFAILSGAPSAAKISTAAITRGIVTRGENIVGQALSLIPGIRQIAKKSPRHGGISVSAESKAFTTWFDKMTIDDVRETMKTGMSSIDYLYGRKEPMGGKVPEWMEFFGRMHSAIKLLPKRAEFFRSLEMRTAHALKNGKDVNDPMVQQEMAGAAYNDAIRAIFMQDNPISSSYTKLVNGLEKDYPAFASVMKFIFPIVKVPVNYVSEQVSYLPPIAAVKMVTTLYKGREGMSEEQADYFMRALKKGAIGTAFIFMGFMNPQALGGYYTGKRKEDELEAGDIKLFGVKLPHFMTHTPLLEMLQVGATMRRASDAKIAKGEEPTKFDGIPAIFKGEMTQVPFIGTGQRVMKLADNKTTDGFKDYVYSMGQSILEPQLMQNIADWTDKEEGETVKRKSGTFVEKLKEGVPGLRKTLKEEDNLKLSKKEQEEYSVLIEKGINIPELNRRTSYRVKNDEQHPDSHMTEEEFTKFISLQKEFANKSYKEYYSEHTELLNKLQKMIDGVPDTPKEKSELNKLKDKIQNRIDAIHNRAIDKAKRKLHLK